MLCISGWDDSGLGSPDVAFFWSGIGIVKARVSFEILVLARHCQDLSKRVIGSTLQVEWILKLCIGIPRFVHATALFWIGAWTVF